MKYGAFDHILEMQTQICQFIIGGGSLLDGIVLYKRTLMTKKTDIVVAGLDVKRGTFVLCDDKNDPYRRK